MRRNGQKRNECIDWECNLYSLHLFIIVKVYDIIANYSLEHDANYLKNSIFST